MQISREVINNLKSIEKEVNLIEKNPKRSKEAVDSIIQKIAVCIAMLSTVYENLIGLKSNSDLD